MSKISIDKHPSFPFAKTIVLSPYVFLSGMVAPKSGSENSSAEEIEYQTKWLLTSINDQLNKAGSSANDILLLRIFLLDLDLSIHVSAAMYKYFQNELPAASVIQVTALPSPTALIEIETYAVLTESNLEKGLKS